MKQMRKHNGFTLIEILLVLVLLSLTAVAVITTLPTSQKTSLNNTRKVSFSVCSCLTKKPYSAVKILVCVSTIPKDLHLLSLTAEGWKPLEMNQIPSKTKLEDDIALQLDLGGGAWDKDDRLFEPGSLFEDMFADETEERK